PGTRGLGAAGERAARRYLQRQGFRILDSNYACPAGELDIVCATAETIVFVEVKSRRDDGHADPEDNITPAKQRKLVTLARYWLDAHGWPERAYRFDALSVVLPDRGEPRIRHIV